MEFKKELKEKPVNQTGERLAFNRHTAKACLGAQHSQWCPIFPLGFLHPPQLGCLRLERKGICISLVADQVWQEGSQVGISNSQVTCQSRQLWGISILALYVLILIRWRHFNDEHHRREYISASMEPSQAIMMPLALDKWSEKQ
jgi:hypothetical protein